MFNPSSSYAIFLEHDDQRNLRLSCQRDIINIISIIRKKPFGFLPENTFVLSETNFKNPYTCDFGPDPMAIKLRRFVGDLNKYFQQKRPREFFDLLKYVCKRNPSMIYIHFSGHGYQMKDKSNDEIDGKDEYINIHLNPESRPRDLRRIFDDDIYQGLTSVVPKDCKLRMTFDCCHSGTMSDFAFKVVPNGTGKDYKLEPFKKNKKSGFFSDAISISACSDNEVDYNEIGQTIGFGGALTVHLLENEKEAKTLSNFLLGKKEDTIKTLNTLTPILKLLNQTPILLFDN